MKHLSKVFDTISQAITSLAAVIFVMLMTIGSMIFFSHTLFDHVFPESMATWERVTATWLMALGWEFTVLLTTCNTKHINKHIPLIMAVCSGVIVLFFIEAFDFSQPWLVIMQRWFVGILAATINYIYAELFYAKWKERNDNQQLPRALVELRSMVNDLQSQVVQAHSERDQLRSEAKERERKLIDLEKFKVKVETELTCPHCKVVHNSFGSLHAHKGHCLMNPRNKMKHLNSNEHEN